MNEDTAMNDDNSAMSYDNSAMSYDNTAMNDNTMMNNSTPMNNDTARQRKEAARIRQQKRRSKLTEEQREMYRQQNSLRRRETRASLSEERRAELRQRDAEKKRLSRENLPPEKREEINRRDAEKHREARKNLSQLRREFQLLSHYIQFFRNAGEGTSSGMDPSAVSNLHFFANSSSHNLQAGIFVGVAQKYQYTLTYNIPDNYITVTDNSDDSGSVLRYDEVPLSLYDFFIGSDIVIGGNAYKLLSYCDDFTDMAVNHWRQSTFGMIKPEAFPRVGEILSVVKSNLHIADMKMVHLTTAQAKQFYQEHKERPFFDDLVSYIVSGPVLALHLMGPSPVRKWRELLGPTDSNLAREVSPSSIRALFGRDKQQNAAHGSDSEDSARRELSLFFADPLEGRQPVSTLLSRTSLLVLPHIVRTDSLGKLLTSLTTEHHCAITALEMTSLSYLEALRFATGELIPDEKEEGESRVHSLVGGTAVYLDLRSQSPESLADFHRRFGDIIGPQDPARARKSFVGSVRANYGEDKINNAVLALYFDLKK